MSRSAGATRSCSIFRQRRIAEALERRAALFERPDIDAFRLLHGDAEGASGLAVDRYGGVAIVHADTEEVLEEWLPELQVGLREVVRTAYAKVHPRSVSRLSEEERIRAAPDEPLWGQRDESVIVEEYGARYEVRPSGSLSVGLFLDMREVRQWLRAATAGLRVLNLFAYTCSLGVCASLGRAQRVVNIDVSRPYLEWGKRNYALNACAVDDHDFIYGDAFDWLGRFARRREAFDMVIVDPPSFSSTPFSVTRDYTRLVAAAARVVSPGGTLLAATNHAATTDERFDAWLRGYGRLVKRWHEPEPDFPIADRPYLKVRAVELD